MVTEVLCLFQDFAFSNASGPPLEEAPKGFSILPSDRKLKVTLLTLEWGPTRGGVSTINRELAIQLAKYDNVEVCMYLPLFSDEDKKAASNCKVRLLKAKERPGYDLIDWLAFPPRDHQIDIVIGHGIHLGRGASLIKRMRPECKWVQVIHIDPEELGIFKTYSDPIATGEKKHMAEVELCCEADQVVAIGPKLAEIFTRYLRDFRRNLVVLLTPGVFSEFADTMQATVTEDERRFYVFVLGCGDIEDFYLQGYDIAAQAVALLKDEEHPFKLVFADAPIGKEEEVKEMLLKEGILPSQLIVRSSKQRMPFVSRFYEADLVILPSRTGGFGVSALEALSAGKPVLVSGNSELGQALQEVPLGNNAVIDSEDPRKWAEGIKLCRRKWKKLRLMEASELRKNYSEKYKWEEQCSRLIEKMFKVVGQQGLYFVYILRADLYKYRPGLGNKKVKDIFDNTRVHYLICFRFCLGFLGQARSRGVTMV